MLYTTLRLLREHHACEDRYTVLRKALPPRYGSNTPIPISRILESNGLDDALWALRAMGNDQALERDSFCRLLASDYAEHVLHLYERRYPGDTRPRQAIDVARRFVVGEATEEELNAAIAAAIDAAWRAAGAAAGAAARAAWRAAIAAARAAAMDAAGAAAGAAARAPRDAAGAAADAAWRAAGAAAMDAAMDAERAWQSENLLSRLGQGGLRGPTPGGGCGPGRVRSPGRGAGGGTRPA